IEEGPHPICFFVPERHTQKSVAGSLDESELDPRDIVRDTIHEIGRIEKYGGYVLFEFGEEGGDERLAPLRLARLAELCKRFVCRRVGITGDVEAGVVALRAVPKRKEVELAAYNLAEEERVVLARADDVLRQVALLVYFDVYLRAHGTQRLAQKLRRRAQLRRAQYGRLVLIKKDAKNAVLRRSLDVFCRQVLKITRRDAARGVDLALLERGQEGALALIETDVEAAQVRLAERVAFKRVERIERGDAG